MRKIKLVLCIAVSLLVAACNSDDVTETVVSNNDDCLTSSSVNSGEIIDGEYIVETTNASAGRISSITTILQRHAIEEKRVNNENTFHKLRLTKEELTKLKNDASIKAVEPDRIISACGCFSVVDPGTITWNTEKVGYGSGEGKTAWIIDTGIESTHPDLFVDEDLSRSFIEGEQSFEDTNGHGTHVAGIIGALNNDIGTLGVASGARLVALKVLDDKGEGKLSSLLQAIDFVNQNAKAGDVVNISITFDSVSEILESAIQRVASRGIYFTLAAGNDSKAASGFSPARTSGKNIYTISAVDSLNNAASFSNYGNDVIDFAAPGVHVLSTFTEGRYAFLSGTSQAAPHAAGILLVNNGVINSAGYATSDPDEVADRLAHR